MKIRTLIIALGVTITSCGENSESSEPIEIAVVGPDELRDRSEVLLWAVPSRLPADSTWAWQLSERPEGSLSRLRGEGQIARYTPDLAGRYVVSVELQTPEGRFETEHVVEALNRPPRLELEVRQPVAVGYPVEVRALARDAERDPLTYTFTWSVFSGTRNEMELGSQTGDSDSLVFTPDIAAVYSVRATASDGTSTSSVAELELLIERASAPVARAGDDVWWAVGDRFVRSPGAFHPDLPPPVASRWELISKPETSSLALDNPDDVLGLYFDAPGRYEFRLIVEDGLGRTSEDAFVARVVQTLDISDPAARQGQLDPDRVYMFGLFRTKAPGFRYGIADVEAPNTIWTGFDEELELGRLGVHPKIDDEGRLVYGLGTPFESFGDVRALLGFVCDGCTGNPREFYPEVALANDDVIADLPCPSGKLERFLVGPAPARLFVDCGARRYATRWGRHLTADGLRFEHLGTNGRALATRRLGDQGDSRELVVYDVVDDVRVATATIVESWARTYRAEPDGIFLMAEATSDGSTRLVRVGEMGAEEIGRYPDLADIGCRATPHLTLDAERRLYITCREGRVVRTTLEGPPVLVYREGPDTRLQMTLFQLLTGP